MSRKFKSIALAVLGLAVQLQSFAQTPFEMRLYPDMVIDNSSETVNRGPDGSITMISGTADPTITVFLPPEGKATGEAVILCSGGGMRFHNWGQDVLNMAAWLNERGVAAIGLKYRLNRVQPAPGQPRMPMAMSLTITEFDQLNNANCNPNHSPEAIQANDEATLDARTAVALVRHHAAEWGIDPHRIGFLGFSAGGGVALASVITAKGEEQADFVATAYGPSLMDVTVPEDAPNLFIATRADHTNVAAGLVALFLEWKKAGAKAEMHIYDDGKSGFGPDDTGTPSGTWRESFCRWLKTASE